MTIEDRLSSRSAQVFACVMMLVIGLGLGWRASAWGNLRQLSQPDSFSTVLGEISELGTPVRKVQSDGPNGGRNWTYFEIDVTYTFSADGKPFRGTRLGRLGHSLVPDPDRPRLKASRS